MKKLALLISLILYFGLSKLSAQDYGNKVDPLKLCIAIQANNFISDAEAENALDRILSVIGASKRFVLQPCDNIDNAVAVSYKGVRYILYDKEFMNSVSRGDNWSNLFILAHEVGHHINGHSLDLILYATETVEAATLASRRQQELEADEFAGFILGKLGASLPQTSQAINLLATDSDDTYSSHPSKSKRLEAISSGFSKGTSNVTEDIEPRESKTAFEYWYSAYQKYKKEDFYGAISDYTSAIRINPNYGGAYNGRGSAKAELKDYYGAIADFSIAVEIDPTDNLSISERGHAKLYLKDFHGAIQDFNKAIKIDPRDDTSYFERGISKYEIKDYYGAIADFNKVIELVPNLTEAYFNRGISKFNLGDLSGACIDARRAKELGNKSADKLISDSCY